MLTILVNIVHLLNNWPCIHNQKPKATFWFNYGVKCIPMCYKKNIIKKCLCAGNVYNDLHPFACKKYVWEYLGLNNSFDYTCEGFTSNPWFPLEFSFNHNYHGDLIFWYDLTCPANPCDTCKYTYASLLKLE